MKKTFNINLAGYPFVIDEDAYNLLKDYLDTIKYAFETPEDTGEIAADIEARIAELILENQNGLSKIVTINEVSKVIERIGKPSDFIEVEESVFTEHNTDKEEIKIEEEKIVPPPYNPKKTSRNPFVRKRLFRDPQNSLLGGVCSGIANYFGIDVTIVRLLTVLLFFLSASTVAILYIILWIVVPEAHTPLQRMQMMGEDTTMENIGKTVTENYQGYENPNSTPQQKAPSGFFHNLLSILVKCLMILGLIIALPLLFAFGLGLIGCIIAVFVLGTIILGGSSAVTFGSATQEVLAFFILLAVIGGIITFGIPLWLLVRKFWKRQNYSPNPAFNRALLIVWLCGLALLAVFTVKAVKKSIQIDRQDWGSYLEQINELDILERLHIDEDDIQTLDINKNEITIIDKNGKSIIINRQGASITNNPPVEEVKPDTMLIDSSMMEETIIDSGSSSVEIVKTSKK